MTRSVSADAGVGADASAGLAEIAALLAKLQEEQSARAAGAAAHAAALARVPVAKEDVDVLAREFEGHLSRAQAERHLRECGGSLEVALRQLVGLEPLAGGPR